MVHVCESSLFPHNLNLVLYDLSTVQYSFSAMIPKKEEKPGRLCFVYVILNFFVEFGNAFVINGQNQYIFLLY